MNVDEVAERIGRRLVLEADRRSEIIAEIRGHLEDAVAHAQTAGLDEAAALAEAERAFDVDTTVAELQSNHVGWGISEGIFAVVLPVLLTLTLRWLLFDPDGSASAWRELPTRPVLLIVGLVAIAAPCLRFSRRRHALALWTFFWALSLATLLWPTTRW